MHLYRRRAAAHAQEVVEFLGDPLRKQTRDGVVVPDIEIWANAIANSYARGVAEAAAIVRGSGELTGRGREEIAKTILELCSR